MSDTGRRWRPGKKPLLLAGIALVLIGGLTLTVSTRARNMAVAPLRWAVNLTRSLADSARVRSDSQGGYTNIVFLHHSVGDNLIEQGGLRERLTDAGFRMYDHGYNQPGLVRPDGSLAGYSYGIPGDNTDPDGLAEVFDQPKYRLPLNAVSGLFQHEVIVFKSCFPTSQIGSDEQLDRLKSYYWRIRDVAGTYPDKVFIAVTPPPLNPAETHPEAASRARAFANWLGSDEFLSGHSNLFTFNLFGRLAENDPGLPDYSMLREAYREGQDSHPNQSANEAVGPLLAEFIVRARDQYQTLK